jgi:hypothetical protein
LQLGFLRDCDQWCSRDRIDHSLPHHLDETLVSRPGGRAGSAAALDACRRYWLQGGDLVACLPIRAVTAEYVQAIPPGMQAIYLPEWATDIGVPLAELEAGRTGLLVPEHTASGEANSAEHWGKVAWFDAIDWYLHAAAERAFEAKDMPIHSYSHRLGAGWDERLWARCWVNRIALFLRRWAAQEHGKSEEALFGPRPRPEILITHDVDAVKKTVPIRLKQSAFQFFNAARRLRAGRIRQAMARSASGLRVLFGSDDYWGVERIAQLEAQLGLRSVFNLYGGFDESRRALKQWLFDPTYDVAAPRVCQTFSRLAAQGWSIGLHQSFDAWRNSEVMHRQKERIESTVGVPIEYCRQHWLRFSWKHTWQAQADAGLSTDMTLGFNDRPGFRVGAALAFRPRNFAGEQLSITAWPMILMDSHLYDYLILAREERERKIDDLLSEVEFVGGQATVIWHTHVFSCDYGWGDGFDHLIQRVSKMCAHHPGEPHLPVHL